MLIRPVRVPQHARPARFPASVPFRYEFRLSLWPQQPQGQSLRAHFGLLTFCLFFFFAINTFSISPITWPLFSVLHFPAVLCSMSFLFKEFAGAVPNIFRRDRHSRMFWIAYSAGTSAISISALFHGLNSDVSSPSKLHLPSSNTFPRTYVHQSADRNDHSVVHPSFIFHL
ncbi:hypothetical protein MPH_10873 [Macrophomina phaseolina MS6]|uniref:Uncharacterized protein n=1 Tax=Macrophomina phaseolina (strain MS6) TaxID=1126212 RepID=K2RBP9_MACPH|nr:hypothetical protein MPH_10873 [Macrophomina phaseolina MS6]